MNFLEETKKKLEENGKSPSDVQFITTVVGDGRYRKISGGWITWEQFEKVADFVYDDGSDFVYDDGFGGNEIHLEVMVVGDSWWLERHEYDGSEWWEFKTPPKRPEVQLQEVTDENLKD